MNAKALGKALKLVRSYQCMKASILIDRLEISRSYLSEIESGKKTPSLKVLASYGEIFNLQISTFFQIAEALHQSNFDVKKTTDIINWVKSMDQSLLK
jgi:transcriptional regulator with XRE-family HTH domain